MNADAGIELRVAEIQRFCMHDGPGVRTTVFLKGCPLRCAWCHNPEMQNYDKELLYSEKKCIGCRACSVCGNGAHVFDGQTHVIKREKCRICGECEKACPTSAVQVCGGDLTVYEIIEEIKKDRAFYGETGGVTLSGGEPFMQKHTTELLKACKERGIGTATETCGFYDVTDAVPYTDLFLWDLKDTNDERHKKYTGVSNRIIIENLFKADEAGAKIRLRCILVNGINTDAEHYKAVANIAARLKNRVGVDILPYHAYGGAKAELLGKDDNGDKKLIPTEEQEGEFRRIVSSEFRIQD